MRRDVADICIAISAPFSLRWLRALEIWEGSQAYHAQGLPGKRLSVSLSLFNTKGSDFRHFGLRWASLIASSKRFFGGTPVSPFEVR